MPYMTEEELEERLAPYEEGCFTTSDPKGAVDIRFTNKSELTAIETVPEMFRAAADNFGDRRALAASREHGPDVEERRQRREQDRSEEEQTEGEEDDEEWDFYTFSEYYEISRKVAKSLIKLGYKRNDVSCIIGSNSPHWFFANLGSVLAGGIGCGIYTTNKSQACHYVINMTSSRFIFVGDSHQRAKIDEIRQQLPESTVIVQMMTSQSDTDEAASDGNLYSWRRFAEVGNDVSDEELESRIADQHPNQCCQIVFTSGTTGKPKGVMLSHDNITWSARTFASWSGMNNEILVSYLPLSHIASQMADMWLPLACSSTVYFAPPDALKGRLAATLKQVRPTTFVAVPRVWEKMQVKLKAGYDQSGRISQAWQRWCAGVGLRAAELRSRGDAGTPVGYVVADIMFDRVRRQLGLDRCWFPASAAAPLGDETQAHLWSSGINLVELYGLSETCGPHVCAVTHRGRFRFQSVGKALPGLRVRIDPDNEEICLWGRNIAMGYIGMEEESFNLFDDQCWFRTGDRGHSDEDGFLYLTGRLKDLIITSGGENIPALRIEAAVRRLLPDVVRHCVLIGDRRHFLTILITLQCKTDDDSDSDDAVDTNDELSAECVSVFRQWGVPAFRLSQISSGGYQEVNDAIRSALQEVNSASTSRAQQIRKWAVLPKAFSVKNGELGPTLKLRRKFVIAKYLKLIDRMYADDDVIDEAETEEEKAVSVHDV